MVEKSKSGFCKDVLKLNLASIKRPRAFTFSTKVKIIVPYQRIFTENARPIYRSRRTWERLIFLERAPSGTVCYAVDGSRKEGGGWGGSATVYISQR
jgi:hypothetical protein